MEPSLHDNFEGSSPEEEIANSRLLIAQMHGFLRGINTQRMYSLMAATLLFMIGGFLAVVYRFDSLLPSVLVLLGYLLFEALRRVIALSRVSRETAIICEYQIEITREAESELRHFNLVSKS